jgi:hypothetical protein
VVRELAANAPPLEPVVGTVLCALRTAAPGILAIAGLISDVLRDEQWVSLQTVVCGVVVSGLGRLTLVLYRFARET